MTIQEAAVLSNLDAEQNTAAESRVAEREHLAVLKNCNCREMTIAFSGQMEEFEAEGEPGEARSRRSPPRVVISSRVNRGSLVNPPHMDLLLPPAGSGDVVGGPHPHERVDLRPSHHLVIKTVKADYCAAVDYFRLGRAQ